MRNNINFLDNINVNNERILISSNTKYLGVVIDEDLNWKEHVQQMCNELKGMFSMFYYIRRYLSVEHVKTIYYTLIYSKIKYGLAVYGAANSGVINSIQTLQNQLLKVLREKPYRYCTNILHNELELIKVEDLYKQEILIFTHSFQNKNLPSIFDHYFTNFASIHNINTRYRNTCFIIPRVSSNLGATQIMFQGAVLWNNLDNKLKGITKLKSFGKSLNGAFLPYHLPL